MPEYKPNKGSVRSKDQLDAIASPVRDQILQVVINQAADPKGATGVSIREIARQIGRKPGSLYRHIDELVRVGLLTDCGPRPSGGREAMTYRAAPGPAVLATPVSAGPELDALCRYIERAGVHAGRESAAATRRRVQRAEDRANDAQGTPDHGMVVMFGWLDDDQRATLRRAMFDIARIYEHAHRRPDTRLIAASLFIRPVQRPNDASDHA